MIAENLCWRWLSAVSSLLTETVQTAPGRGVYSKVGAAARSPLFTCPPPGGLGRGGVGRGPEGPPERWRRARCAPPLGRGEGRDDIAGGGAGHAAVAVLAGWRRSIWRRQVEGGRTRPVTRAGDDQGAGGGRAGPGPRHAGARSGRRRDHGRRGERLSTRNRFAGADGPFVEAANAAGGSWSRMPRVPAAGLELAVLRRGRSPRNGRLGRAAGAGGSQRSDVEELAAVEGGVAGAGPLESSASYRDIRGRTPWGRPCGASGRAAGGAAVVLE